MKKLIVLILIVLFAFPVSAFCQDSFFNTPQWQRFERGIESARKEQKREMRKMAEEMQRMERERKRGQRVQRRYEQNRDRKERIKNRLLW